MLAPFCPTHGARVLVPTNRILAVFNTTTGIHVAYRCWCDDVGIWRPERTEAGPDPDGSTGDAQEATDRGDGAAATSSL